MNFNKEINRKNTGSLKWDSHKKFNKPESAVPFWLADMDFSSPEPVVEALIETAKFGVYGYGFKTEPYYDAIISWQKRRHNWNVDKSWIITTHGVISALSIAIKTFTKEGEAILIQPPVYSNFSSIIAKTKRKKVESSLVLEGDSYKIDFDDFEKQIKEEDVKLFIMSNPHNPVGKVFTEEELRKMGDICIKHNVIVLSDEIHQDFIFKPYKHIPFASLGKKYEDISVICTAPSKTFNIAGLQTSNIMIPNEDLRIAFKEEQASTGVGEINTFGLRACEVAYNKGEPWLEEVMSYLKGNMAFTTDYISKNMPKLKVIKTEATYLMWVDFRGLDIEEEELNTMLLEKADFWAGLGSGFGQEGKGFYRINIACPRKILEEALNRILKLYKEL